MGMHIRAKGATVSVGDSSIVGENAVVIDDAPENLIIVGIPAHTLYEIRKMIEMCIAREA